jgi:hypothetical protein
LTQNIKKLRGSHIHKTHVQVWIYCRIRGLDTITQRIYYNNGVIIIIIIIIMIIIIIIIIIM